MICRFSNVVLKIKFTGSGNTSVRFLSRGADDMRMCLRVVVFIRVLKIEFLRFIKGALLQALRGEDDSDASPSRKFTISAKQGRAPSALRTNKYIVYLFLKRNGIVPSALREQGKLPGNKQRKQ